MKYSREHRTVPLSSIAASIAEGNTTPSAIAEDCLTRIERSEPSVLAWKFIDPHVRRHAALLDDSGPVGPLHGIPIGVKDVFDTSDMPTTYGSKLYEGHQPASDASAVSILRDAGALIVGKTVTTEFASVAPPVTRNPRNLEHTPGGSSSGSAAAVAADMVPVALGTQTAGSVIRPAAYCGVVGYKPSFGLVDRTGVKTLAQSFDTVGVFSRNVSDAALVTAVLANRQTLRDLSTPANLKFGLFLPPWLHLGQPCAGEVVLHVGALLRNAGYSVATVSQIKGFDTLLGAQESIMDWDMRHALFFEFKHGGDKLHPVTQQALAMRHARARFEKVDAAREVLKIINGNLDDILSDFDVLIVPSSPGEAPKGHLNTGASDFNRGWTALGVPCINLPAGTGPLGLPLGVQLISKHGHDHLLLSVAQAVEQVLVNETGA